MLLLVAFSYHTKTPQSQPICKSLTYLDLVWLIGWVGRLAETCPTKREDDEEPGGGRHHSHPGPHAISSLVICKIGK